MILKDDLVLLPDGTTEQFDIRIEGGISPVSEMLAKGIPVSLGTDGKSSNDSQDLYEVVKAVALFQPGHHASSSCRSRPVMLAANWSYIQLGQSRRTTSARLVSGMEG